MGPAAWRTLRRVRERSRLTEGRGAGAELVEWGGRWVTSLFCDSEDGQASGAGGGCHRGHLPGVRGPPRGQAQALPGGAEGAAADGAAHLDPGEHRGGRPAGSGAQALRGGPGTSSEQSMAEGARPARGEGGPSSPRRCAGRRRCAGLRVGMGGAPRRGGGEQPSCSPPPAPPSPALHSWSFGRLTTVSS